LAIALNASDAVQRDDTVEPSPIDSQGMRDDGAAVRSQIILLVRETFIFTPVAGNPADRTHERVLLVGVRHRSPSRLMRICRKDTTG
jgi:hypothetical protein